MAKKPTVEEFFSDPKHSEDATFFKSGVRKVVGDMLNEENEKKKKKKKKGKGNFFENLGFFEKLEETEDEEESEEEENEDTK